MDAAVSERGPLPGRRRALGRAVGTAVLLLGLLALAYALGRLALFALVAAVALGGALELFLLLQAAGRRPVIAFGLVCVAAVLVAGYAAEPAWILGALGVAAGGGLVLGLRPGRGPVPLSDAAWTTLAVVWIGGGGAAAIRVAGLEPGGDLLAAVVVVAAADDTAAFFVGTVWGRHRMAPSISAAKSWEGFAGGTAAALAAGAVVGGVLDVLSVIEGIGLGFVCSVAGPLGDLVESLAKREIGVKDSGTLLPGHGGLLDRIDALLLSAPAALLYLGALPG